jgi:hypothetical protein
MTILMCVLGFSTVLFLVSLWVTKKVFGAPKYWIFISLVASFLPIINIVWLILITDTLIDEYWFGRK